jgi:hypothetical protein
VGDSKRLPALKFDPRTDSRSIPRRRATDVAKCHSRLRFPRDLHRLTPVGLRRKQAKECAPRRPLIGHAASNTKNLGSPEPYGGPGEAIASLLGNSSIQTIL